MGKIQQGILGGVSGLVGTVVGAIVRGVATIRIRPKKSTKTPKQSQINQRTKFSVATDFVFQTQDVMRVGYQYYENSGMSAVNAAVQYHLKNAVTGVAPDFEIDYASVQISKDKAGLEQYGDASIAPAAGAILNLTWDPAGAYVEEQQLVRGLDKVLFLLYDETKDLYFVSVGAGLRSKGQFAVHLPKIFVGGNLHSWFCFYSADGKVSKSQYLGPVKAIA